MTIWANRFRVSYEEQQLIAPQTVRPVEAINQAEDDLLESSDVAVPLAEPGKVRPAPRVPAADPRPAHEDSPPILPEVLELAPSDIFPSIPPDSHPSL